MLVVQTTGLDQYAPGGEARIKVMVIGGPGVGKTRWSSFFPKPIYADCEAGLASVADRRVPFVPIHNSQDMLDLLAFLKQECRQPPQQRKYETVVIDTLDAFQRKIKNEWMELNRKDAFNGWEAWGYLNAKMQTLLTRLLNLDMHVIVCVHFKDKVTRDDDSGRESHSFMLQLQGETADSVYNDFDLVGWMGTYWESEQGERVQKRGLTFIATPDKPFLKDRLFVTPSWLPVEFAYSDYTNLFERITQRLADLARTETVEEISSASDEIPENVVSPGQIGGGPVKPQAQREIPLSQLDKPTLAKRVRDAGITTTVDGAPIRANTLKSELIAALEAHQQQEAQQKTESDQQQSDQQESDASPATAATQPVASAGTGAAGEDSAPATGPVKTVAEGTVDVTTGELINESTSEPASGRNLPQPEPTIEQAVAEVEKTLGGEVEDQVASVPPAAFPASVPSATSPDSWGAQPPEASGVVHEHECEDCEKPLNEENPDFVKVARIRFRKWLCNSCYQKRKLAR